jgi:hypothetical protein
VQYFYFISLFFGVVLTIHCIKDTKENVYIYYWFVLIVALAIGLRGNEDEYTRVFALIPPLSDFFLDPYGISSEKGFIFYFISSFFKELSLNSQSLFLFFSSTAVFIHAFFFRKYTKYYFLAFLFYLSHEIAFKEWVGLRMGFASALLLPMIYYLNQNKISKFLWLVLIATLVQYVAILSLFLLLLRRRIRPELLWFGLIIAVVILQFNLVHSVVWFLDSVNILPNIVSSYLRSDSYVYDVGLRHPKTIQQLITVSVLIILFGYRKEAINQYYNLLFNAYYLGTIFLVTFAELALLAFRFNGHFYTVEPILITYIIVSFRQRKLAANLLAVVALCVAYLNYVIVERISPYDFLVNYPS